jgi:hypothetical protein
LVLVVVVVPAILGISAWVVDGFPTAAVVVRVEEEERNDDDGGGGNDTADADRPNSAG